MGSGDFNRIPSQCEGICELTQAMVDKHSIVVSRNCTGPNIGNEDASYSDSSRVEYGEITEIDETSGSSAGRLACRNAGVNLWLDDRKQAYKERTAS